MTDQGQRQLQWYRFFRWGAYLSAFAALAWTVAIVLPFPPFTNIPPIIVDGGPGTWFLLSYVLFILIGTGGFGTLSGFLATMELQEERTLDARLMWPALLLFSFGLAGSCTMLAVAGYQGGYAYNGGASSHVLEGILSPYQYPTTAFVVLAVLGAALALLSMVRARWPAP